MNGATQSKRNFALASLGFAVITAASLYWVSNRKADVAHSSIFAGNWKVVGIDGDLRRNALLTLDGRVVTDDNYSGIWIADDSNVHIVTWATRQDGHSGSFSSKPAIFSLAIDKSPDKQISLVGENVVLHR